MIKTKFTQLVGCQVPIQQAGMGDIANPSLAAAVSNAGALEMVSVTGISDEPPRVEKWVHETRQLTRNEFGVNFIIAEDFLPDLTVIHDSVEIASKIANVVEFFYRKPDPSLIELVHKGGALAFWQVGSKEEALAAVDVGCDVIVAQGIEAGGHIRGKLGLFTVLNEVLGSVNVPVLAAGGIGSGRTMAATLTAGASGVRVGTRFIAAKESVAHPEYVDALISSGPEDTVVTETFSRVWHAPHRVLRFSMEEALSFKGEVVGKTDHYEIGEMVDVHRLSAFTMTKKTTGTLRAMPHWAGESVGEVRKIQTAAEIVQELLSEAEKLLRGSSAMVD